MCIASRTVPLNVDKNGGMFCGGFCKKSVSHNTYSSDSSSWILNGLVSSCFDKCWYLWWRRAFSLTFGSKQRNRWHKTGHFAVQESARVQTLHRSDMYVVVISWFHSTFYAWKPKLRELICWIFFCRVLSITVKSSSENIWQKCLQCFFSPNLYWTLIGKYLGRYFLLISIKVNPKYSFRVLVDVQ